MSEKWHDDHKKAIAEKWTQCPPVTVKVKELISGQVCMGTYGLVELEVMQLETKLAEARAEIERLKQLWSCNLDIIGGELNKQLVEAQADAEHWKSECNALQRMVHEARAEIERLNKDHNDAIDTIFAMLIAARGEDCTIEVLHAEMNAVSTKPSEYIKHVIAERDKLVEQMRDALLLFAEGAIHDFHYVCQHRDNCLCLACQKVRVKAALAAERGE